jgi:PPM family protein phosphatase
VAKTIALAALQQGQNKSCNEDNFFLLDTWATCDCRSRFHYTSTSDDVIQCYAVADGSGGNNLGYAASETALAMLDQYRKRIRKPFDADVFIRAYLNDVNRVLYRLLENELGRAVGTTLTLLILDHGTASIASIGNSSVYLCRGEQCRCLTEQHSEWLPDRIGGLTQVQNADPQRWSEILQTEKIELEKGDVFLLATDGLTDQVSCSDISEILRLPTAFGQKIDRLQEKAVKAGLTDDLAMVTIRILDLSDNEQEKEKRHTRANQAILDRQPSMKILRRQDSLIRMTFDQCPWIRIAVILFLAGLLAAVLIRALTPLPDWLLRWFLGI